MSEPLVTLTEAGLYCPQGDFYIDPWHPVPRAVITHGHGDHLRSGCQRYVTAREGLPILHARIGTEAAISTAEYGESLDCNGVRVSLHPAGHILGAAQVRIEHRGEVWVVTGDYKVADDPTCTPFECVRCDTLITESTFGLPIYRWEPPAELFARVNDWWRSNQAAGKTSVLFAYALGKSQRLLAGVDASIGPIFTHGSTERINRAYRDGGVALPVTRPVSEITVPRGKEKPWTGGLIIAPSWAASPGWLRKFEPYSDAIASGWMQVRGARRRSVVDRGFVLSDHADWPGLLSVIKNSGASRVLATHGFASVVARWCREQGLDGGVIATRFGDDERNAEAAEEET
ncbi:MAG TPA: ligase-associated DNA damage response exonuclease [Planctomycetaceae bacterium]|nr:ligase-associated DNA damage response exonuclease [Planctomycetaceae bacterium]